MITTIPILISTALTLIGKRKNKHKKHDAEMRKVALVVANRKVNIKKRREREREIERGGEREKERSQKAMKSKYSKTERKDIKGRILLTRKEGGLVEEKRKGD